MSISPRASCGVPHSTKFEMSPRPSRTMTGGRSRRFTTLVASSDFYSGLDDEQQQMLDDLSEVLTRQTKDIEALKARLSASDNRIAELEAGLPAPANEKPPHY